MRRKAYRLHILIHDPSSKAYTIALAELPLQRNSALIMPLANFPSSKQLASALSRVGVPTAVLRKMKTSLDTEGLHRLTDLMLSDEQVASLGFKITA